MIKIRIAYTLGMCSFFAEKGIWWEHNVMNGDDFITIEVAPDRIWELALEWKEVES